MSHWGASRAFSHGQRQPALRARFCVPCQAERPFRGRRCTVCKRAEPKVSKYGNVPVREVNADGTLGRLIHSKREARRWADLQWLEQAGQITQLRRQVEYRLVVNGLLVTTYRADFVYFDVAAGREVVEDSKGWPSETWPLKKRLMLALHGIEVLET